MLIGYIEQEIIEDKFWYFWLNTYPNDSGPVDLQKDQDDEHSEQVDRSHPVDIQSSSHLM